MASFYLPGLGVSNSLSTKQGSPILTRKAVVLLFNEIFFYVLQLSSFSSSIETKNKVFNNI